MGLTITVDMSGLTDFIATLQEKCQTARETVAEEVRIAWAADVLASERGIDTPADREDYDEELYVAPDGDDRTVVYTTIPWAPAQEYGDYQTPARPSATQAAEENRDRFTEETAAELQRL